jgi:hypothetical protein
MAGLAGVHTEVFQAELEIPQWFRLHRVVTVGMRLDQVGLLVATEGVAAQVLSGDKAVLLPLEMVGLELRQLFLEHPSPMLEEVAEPLPLTRLHCKVVLAVLAVEVMAVKMVALLQLAEL